MANGDAVMHRLFLIRHGETVDNVAGLYAGVRDSALTNHGFQQASRLGQYLALNKHRFTHIFSSDLSRAFKTAETVRTTQHRRSVDADLFLVKSTIQIPELREQDFGFYEGKPFYTRSANSNKSGKDALREDHRNEPGFKEVESKESMAKRADAFLDKHLMPTLVESKCSLTIAVVSHGLLLSSLWRCLLRRQQPSSITLNPEFAAESTPASLEHLGGWANTGFLELEMTPSNSPATLLRSPDPASGPEAVTPSAAATAVEGQAEAEEVAGGTNYAIGNRLEAVCDLTAADSSIISTPKFAVFVRTINGREHLIGLKRTGGGVGSAKHDEGQKSIQSFFKRRKTEG